VRRAERAALTEYRDSSPSPTQSQLSPAGAVGSGVGVRTGRDWQLAVRRLGAVVRLYGGERTVSLGMGYWLDASELRTCRSG
jgi:hypothetical protein